MGRVGLQRGGQRICVGIGVIGQQVARHRDTLAGGECVGDSGGPAIDSGHRCGDHDHQAVRTAQSDELGKGVEQCLDDPGRTGKPVGASGVDGDAELIGAARPGELRVWCVRVPTTGVDHDRAVRRLVGELVAQQGIDRSGLEIAGDDAIGRLAGRLDRARGGLFAEERVADDLTERRGTGCGRGGTRRGSNWRDHLADTTRCGHRGGRCGSDVPNPAVAGGGSPRHSRPPGGRRRRPGESKVHDRSFRRSVRDADHDVSTNPMRSAVVVDIGRCPRGMAAYRCCRRPTGQRTADT